MSKIVIEDCSKPEKPEVVLECGLRTDHAYAIGRNPANDIYLDHPSISRLHAVLFNLNGSWHLHDPGSKKGVLNAEGSPVVLEMLKDGSYLSIGPTRLWFQEDKQADSRTRSGTKQEPEFVSILQCTLVEKDNPWVDGENTEQVFHYCMGNRRSLTLGSGVECDLTLPTPELADIELILFELNDTWRFSCLADLEVSGPTCSGRSGKLMQNEECTLGPLKFSIFRAKLMP